jgi:antitoxin MazE
MVSKIQKWGNSLAVRIPKPFADSVGFDIATEVDFHIEDDRLVITKSSPSDYSLNELLSQVTSDNLHGEVDLGIPIGHEEW